MRRLGMGALAAALGDHVALAPTADEATILSAFLDSSRPTARHRARITNHYNRPYTLTEPPQRLDDLSIAIIDAGRPRGSIGALRDRLFGFRNWQGRGPIDGMSVLSIMAETVWRDDRFAAETAGAIRQGLKPRLLFRPGGAPIVTLHPGAFWVLTAAWIGAPQGIRWRRRRQEWSDRFIKTALGQAKAGPWAGFWEQWLMLETRRLRGSDLPDPVRAVIEPLPLLAGGVAALAAGYQVDDKAKVALAKDWRQTVPSFATRLLDGKI